MSILTNDIAKADGITHSGVFHADDVFSSAFLKKYYELQYHKSFQVARVPKWPMENITPCDEVIVFDIGMGKFDHHGKQLYRFNEVPYAAFGKLWLSYGREYVKLAYPELSFSDATWVTTKFDQIFIQGLDAVDCGVMPRVEYPAQPMSISTLIADMNPGWDETDDPSWFCNACNMAESILAIVLNRVVSMATARHIVRKAIDTAINKGTVIILDRFCPWQEELINGTHPNAENVLYILYPSNRNPGYWKWQVVPTAVGSFEQRCHVPKAWCGKTGHDLFMASGFSCATFVHASGFLGECMSLEEAKLMVGSAIVQAIARGELIDIGESIVRNKDYHEETK